MNPVDAMRALFSQALTDAHRPLRFAIDKRGERARQPSPLQDLFLVQEIDIRERLNEGTYGHVNLLSTRHDLPLERFEGVPAEVQIVTARGTLRAIPGLIEKMLRGPSDNGFTLYQATLVDPLYLLRKRCGKRAFGPDTAIGVICTVLDQLRRDAPRLGRSFDYVLQLDASRYPTREFTLHAGESIAHFLIRTMKRAGMSFFFRPRAHNLNDPAQGAQDDKPAIELVIFDDAMRLDPNIAGELKFHRQSATETADSIVLWAEMRQLTPGRVQRESWNYKAGGMDRVSTPTLTDHGEAGRDIAAYLADLQTERPHDGDSRADFEQLTRVRMLRHEFEAAAAYAITGSRDIQVGQYNPIVGHGALDLLNPEAREHVWIDIHHRGRNNHREIGPRVAKLLQRCEQLPEWLPSARFDNPEGSDPDGGDPDAQHKYLNRCTAIQRGVQLVPKWDPRVDLPVMHTLTAIVLGGPEGQEVLTDDLGRYKVRIQGLDNDERDLAATAWVRHAGIYTGQGVDLRLPLRGGMEVEISFCDGDPDRPVITRVLNSSVNPPGRFDHLAGLPNNASEAGLITREFNGTQQNQLRFIDRTGQLSVQMGTDHAATQFNGGSLHTEMNEGQRQPRGEGAEIRTDEAGVFRTGKAMFLLAWARLRAIGKMLDAQEPLALMQDFLSLFRSLGQYGAQHQGLAVDDASATELHADVKAAAAGSNTDPKGEGGKPTISISAPAGIATTTPKTLLSYAGINIDSVAQQHYQVTAGQRYNLNAGQGIGMFAHHGGLQAIAHHGRFLMQAQHGAIEANATDGIRWTVSNGKLVGMAKEIIFATENGDFLHLGGPGGAVLNSQTAILLKASDFKKVGPASMSVDLPTFSEGDPERFFVLRHGGEDSPVAANRDYRAQLSDGSFVEGTTDAQGNTQILQRDAMHMTDIQFIDKPKA